jgi:hypothetical protein
MRLDDEVTEVDESTGAWPARTTWETAQMPTFKYRRDFFPTLFTGMSVCREHNHQVVPLLQQLQEFDFFSYFAFDLLASCSYMPTSENPCELDRCEVEPAEDVPEALRARDLSESEFALDCWARKDMPSDFTEYYDLRVATERNTGYDGRRIWRFIHQKICFQENLELLESGWKRDFNRAVSGMHAAVDCQILNDIGLTSEGRMEYQRRLRDEPDSIANLYFAYMLTLCAIRDCRERLDKCRYLGEGGEVLPVMRALTASALVNDEAVQAAAQNLRDHAQLPTAAVWKARLRTRDLTAIMNCVQCNLCRLHGKVMALGLGATMQVLLGDDGRGGDPLALDRAQVGALVATAAKFGNACQIVERFREFDGDDMTKAFGADDT